jgi:hypothetical protein
LHKNINMRKVATLLILFSLVLTGCKKEKSVDDLPVVKPEVEESKVQVVLDAVVKKDDSFQVFYTQDGTLNFDEKYAVRVNIKGSEVSQKIVFDLPDDIAFTYLRIDTGENDKQEVIKVNNLLIKYYDKKLEAKGNGIFQYFTPNDQMVLDNANATLTPKQVAGKKYDAILYPLETLGPALQKLIK